MTRKGTKILKPEFCEVSEDIFEDGSLISFDPCFQPKGGRFRMEGRNRQQKR